MDLTYNSFREGLSCDCFENSSSATVTTFGIKTNEKELKEKHFKSKWEKVQHSEKEEWKKDLNCSQLCGKKGVSLSRIDANNRTEVLEIFIKLFPLAPGYKPYLSIINLHESSGKVKSTPSIKNKYHHDLYKSDQFDHNKIALVESIDFHNNV